MAQEDRREQVGGQEMRASYSEIKVVSGKDAVYAGSQRIYVARCVANT